MKKVFAAFFAISIFVLNFLTAFAAEESMQIDSSAQPYCGQGTNQDPYVYLIDENSKVTWKHLNEIKQKGTVEEYQKRTGNSIYGNLIYKWTFYPENITTAYGPYFLGINFYNGGITEGLPGGDAAKYFSFANKRDFAGAAVITMDVSECFSNGDRLTLAYYGGYDATVYHAASPVIDKNEIKTIGEKKIVAEKLPVENGMVSFPARYGGNYFLTKDEPIQKQTPAAVSTGNQTAPDNSPGFSGILASTASEAPLGHINEIFPNEEVAKAIAIQTGKKTSDLVSQGDLDSIQSLFLDNIGLSDLSILSRYSFAHLTSLSLANNTLTEIQKLKMPMLSRLDLSGNCIISLKGIDKTNQIKHLLLADNGLTALPDLSAFQLLQTLDLSRNLLSDISGLALPKLTYINLSGNCLKNKPEFPLCPMLTEVDYNVQASEKNRIDTDLEDSSQDNRALPAIITVIAVITIILSIPGVKYFRKKVKSQPH